MLPVRSQVVRALFDFEANEADDVDFKMHDLIRVVSKPEDSTPANVQNGEWWVR